LPAVHFKTGSTTVASGNGNGRSSRDHNRLGRGEGYDRYALQIFQPGKLVDRTVPLGRPTAGPGGRSLFSDQLVAIIWGRALILSLPIQRWPDFKKWDDRDEFELFEAAALWFDAEPRLPMWWRARRQFQLWKLAISSGAIPINSQAPIEVSEIAAPTTSSVTPHTRIHREALKRLAEKEGRKPLFLFPERRR
jgi:hypothetical protein